MGSGDVIDGFQIATVQRFDVNNANQLAHMSLTTAGTRGVFAAGRAVAVANGTSIDGHAVLDLYPDELDQNEAGQVAFVANVDGLDGLYVATPTGLPAAPFSYRKVFEAGQTIDGVTIGSIRQVDLNNASLISGYVETPGGARAYIRETSLGVLDALVSGDQLGGLTVAMNLADPATPQVDDDGNVYVYVGTTQVSGPTLFRNGQPLVQSDVPGATAPIRVSAWFDDIKILDVGDDDRVLLYGRTAADPSNAVLRADAIAGTISSLFIEGSPIPGWTIEAIDTAVLDERHADNNRRTFVVHGGGRSAVSEDDHPYVRDGQTVNGHVFTGFSAPQVDFAAPVFIGHFAGGNGIFNATQQFVATGDIVAGYTIQSVTAHSMTNGVNAFTAVLSDGRVGVFRGSAAIAVEGGTINGSTVAAIMPAVVRKNESGAVAFVASLNGMSPAIFVASGSDGAITFRRAAGVGDLIAGQTVAALIDVRLDDGGLASFRAGDTASAAVLFRETSLGGYQTWKHGDVVNGLTLDFSLGEPAAPRVDASGSLFLSVPVAPVGQLVFVSGQPIAHAHYQPPPPGGVAIQSFAQAGYVDHDDSGRFLVYGTRQSGEQPGILSVDTQALTITPLLTQQAVINGFIVDSIDPTSVQGYADDGVPLERASNGQFAILTPSAVVARTGDVVGGHTLQALAMPRRTASGSFYFLGDEAIYGRPPEGAITRRRGGGDLVAGHSLLNINYFVVNDADDLAYSAALLAGRYGLFFNDDPVAIESATQIEDVTVAEVGSGVANSRVEVSVNDAGQIALIARLTGQPYALFVATPAAPLDLNLNGAVDLPDLGEFGLCLSGPNQLVTAECKLADADGDCKCGLRDFAAFQIAFGTSVP